jgi:hypothetical protein
MNNNNTDDMPHDTQFVFAVDLQFWLAVAKSKPV